MKVLLIAGFLDEEIRSQGIFKEDSALFHKLVALFKLPSRVGQLRDHAPWVRGMISFLEMQPTIDLHVFGPQIRLKKKLTEFELRGVSYHFYRSEYTSFLRMLRHYGVWKRMQRAGHYFRRVLAKVQPDLVVLSGAENPSTSVSVLYAGNCPCLCLCQTVYNNPDRSKYGSPDRLIQNLEKDIVAHLQYFGVYSSLHYDLLHRYRPDATILKFGYPSKGALLMPSEVEKQYDFVNFALMHGSRKGTPDSIRALAIVKKRFPDATLNIVGGCDPAVLAELRQLCEELGVAENVTFTPFFENRPDLLRHIQKARFAVLPCKLDHIAGTMTQSMQLGLPVVVYKTTGTPSFNRRKPCALIAEMGNVAELSQHMLSLLDNPALGETLKRNAREYQEQKAEERKHNGDRLIATFQAVIDNCRGGTPIPQELLFNPEIDD